MLDYRVETFLTLCDTMNYHAAAQRLCITQPTVTQHIQYLEQYYGQKFFSYDGRRLQLTPQGQSFLRYAHTARYQAQKISTSLSDATDCVHLSIGATKTIGEFVITDQICSYLSSPQNTLSLEVDNTAYILSKLDRSELDFALIEGFFDRSKYACRLYEKAAFVGICHKDHPFAGKTVPMESIWQQDLFLREEGSGTRSILQNLLDVENRSISNFSRVTYVGNFGLMENLIARQMGITFAYAAVLNKNESLASFTVAGWENVSREFNYVYLPDTDALSRIEFFDSFR